MIVTLKNIRRIAWKRPAAVFMIFIFAVTEVTHAQVSKITIQVLDGRNGKPFAKHRLLVFTGDTERDAELHKGNIVLTTDETGVATLENVAADIRWIQVFPDWLTLCATTIRPNPYSLEEISSTGARVANSCSGLTKDLLAGRLIVFARPMTFSEKMQR